jgi:hypothetical protein
MTMTTTDVTTIAPLTHDEAMRLQAQELGHVLALLRALDDGAWTAPTDCPAWEVRAMCQHVLGVAHALDRPLDLSAGHDGRIVADIVVEWARRHGRPFVLELTGPAGATYSQHPHDSEAESLKLDAIRFCRTLAGRVQATGLLATIVPF